MPPPSRTYESDAVVMDEDVFVLADDRYDEYTSMKKSHTAFKNELNELKNEVLQMKKEQASAAVQTESCNIITDAVVKNVPYGKIDATLVKIQHLEEIWSKFDDMLSKVKQRSNDVEQYMVDCIT